MLDEPKKKSGCLKQIIVTVVAISAIFFAVDWWDTRPKRMLKRFLDAEWSDKITRIESEFIGGMDFTAYIYLEGDPEFLREIISNSSFKQTSETMHDDRISHLNFEGAPEPPLTFLVIYERHEGTVIEYIGIAKDGASLWYVALDY